MTQTKTKERIKDFGEVYTNNKEIKAMLDLIPSIKDLSTTILEPTCGNGNFILNIIKERKYNSVESFLENVNNLFGCDILEDNILETKHRIISLFSELFENESLENLLKIIDSNFKVLNFLESDLSIFKNIDVVIGNPPYQRNDNGFGSSATPIYNLFIEKIIDEIEPKYFSFIIPSRWLTGGKGLKDFRKRMLNDNRIKILVDYKNDKECFPTVDIEGGVCYFLWDKNYHGLCTYIEMKDGKEKSIKDRILNEFDIFIRDNNGYSILKKIQKIMEEKNINKFSKNIKRPTFGINTNFKDFSEKTEVNYIPLFGNQLLIPKESRNRDMPIGYVALTQLKGDITKVNGYKVLVAKARGGIAKDKKILSKPILTPNISVCSQTFVILYNSLDKEESLLVKRYIETKFFRFLVSLRKLTQDLSISVYDFIPDLSKLDIEINDKELYKFFSLSKEDIEYIENRIDSF
jgi:site-specific DNA-methyltransferase (adenine-specific)